MTSFWLKKLKIIPRSKKKKIELRIDWLEKFLGEIARENPFLGSRGDAKTQVFSIWGQFLGDILDGKISDFRPRKVVFWAYFG